MDSPSPPASMESIFLPNLLLLLSWIQGCHQNNPAVSVEVSAPDSKGCCSNDCPPHCILPSSPSIMAHPILHGALHVMWPLSLFWKRGCLVVLVWIVGVGCGDGWRGVVEKKCAGLEEWWKQSGMVLLWRSHPHEQQGS